ICDRAFVRSDTDVRFKHQIKLAGLSQVFAAAIRALLDASFLHELSRAQVGLASAAINHRIGKSFNVGGGLENRRMAESRAVHPDYVIALMHDHAPPVILQIAL